MGLLGRSAPSSGMFSGSLISSACSNTTSLNLGPSREMRWMSCNCTKHTWIRQDYKVKQGPTILSSSQEWQLPATNAHTAIEQLNTPRPPLCPHPSWHSCVEYMSTACNMPVCLCWRLTSRLNLGCGVGTGSAVPLCRSCSAFQYISGHSS